MSPKGEARRNTYKPGEPRVRSEPAEEGDYELVVLDYGKPGLKGWKVKNPKKFPNRMVRLSMLGTEDEETGKEKTLVEFASTSPAAFFKIADLAEAAGYPEELDLPRPKKPSETALVRECCEGIEKLLKWLKDEEKVLKARVIVEEYKGRHNNKVADWLPEDAELSETASEDEDSDDDTDEDEETPKSKKSKAKAEAEDEDDSDADEDLDGADEGDEDDDSDSDDDDDEPSEPKGKIHPGKKVKQGPAGHKGSKKSKK